MADTITRQTIVDGERNAVVKVHIASDGTGSTNASFLDISALLNSPSTVTIERIWAGLSGFSVDLIWDADSNVDIITLPDGDLDWDFRDFGGLPNNAGTGVTGDILFSSRNTTADDEGTIIVSVKKN